MERIVFLICAALLSATITTAQLAHGPQSSTLNGPGILQTGDLVPKPPVPSGRNTSTTGFEENKGQVRTTHGQPAPFVRYQLRQGNTSVFLLERGIAYQFKRIHEPEGYAQLRNQPVRTTEENARLEAMEAKHRLETYRMDMDLEGADSHAHVSTEGRSHDYTNYYNRDALDVRKYSKVVYHEVYPNIDWAIHTTEKGFEYNFIVRPGGDPSRIKLRFKDHEELFVDESGEIIYGNRLGRFTEEKPVSWQDVPSYGKLSAGRESVSTRFHLEDDLLSFEVGSYDRDRTLTIDPECVWGTYYGGGRDENNTDGALAVDANGNTYLAGFTKSDNLDWTIATPGAHDEILGVNPLFFGDAMLVKFSPGGDRLWGTYYGGERGTAFSSCAVGGPDGSVFAAGITNSAVGVAFNGYDTVHGGFYGDQSESRDSSYDGLLVKFDTAGTPLWATYYGGAKEDRATSCAVAPNGSVYLAGYTSSQSDIASQGNMHQFTNGGYTDGFLVKFNTFGQRQWGTYYGGLSNERVFGCAVDGSAYIYIAGDAGFNVNGVDTISTTGSHQESIGDAAADAFLAKFNPGGGRVWGTWYGGNNSEVGFSCAVDDGGNVFLAGETRSTNDSTIATINGHQYIHGGSLNDAFMVKFNGLGVRQWGTYYGGALNDGGRDCATDRYGNSYLCGMSASSGLSTPNACDADRDGSEAFLVSFRPNGERAFCTYYGGLGDDEGYECALDTTGAIYLVGTTVSEDHIHYGNGFDSTYVNGDGYDAFLAKLQMLQDCNDEWGGPALPGASCDDNDPCTINDVYTGTIPDCGCAGTAAQDPSIIGNVLVANGVNYTYVVSPVIPGAEYHWSLWEGGIPTETTSSSVEVTATPGNTPDSLCVTMEVGPCTYTSCMTIFLLVGLPEPGSNSTWFSVRPNPNDGHFDLLRGGPLTGPVRYTVEDPTGRTLQGSGDFFGPSTDIALGEAPPGVYLLRVQHQAGVQVLRLVVHR